MKIAYLGPEASFSHLAAKNIFSQAKNAFVSVDAIADIFKLVKNHRADYGVVPVENSNAGSVWQTLDAFSEKNFKLQITQEYFLDIKFQFLSQENNPKKIKLIYANPMALAQCQKWLKKNFPKTKIEQVASNSLAARKTAENQQTAALGTAESAETYNLHILANDIQDYQINITRFLVISQKIAKPSGRDKTSLLFTLKHVPGSLYTALGALAKKNINMTKIESRNIKMSQWEYHFFIDIEGHAQNNLIKEALKEMKKSCLDFKILGSYPRGESPWS